MKAIFILNFLKPLLPLLILFNLQAYGENVQIKMVISGQEKAIHATLIDNETTREFIALLPLTLTLNDYNETEKISDLPKKLTRKGAPSAMAPAAGDIAYYAPWGNLAIFYKGFGNSPGLIKLGTIDSGLERLTESNAFKITISRLE